MKTRGREAMPGEGARFVESAQDRIDEKAQAGCGEVVFERWRHTMNMGPLDDPDGYARLKGRCGDAMEIFLKLEGDRVTNATFTTDGCGSSKICGSFAAEMAVGKSPDEILEITGEAVLERVGGMPSGERHCAFLAAETLQEALHDYMLKQKSQERRKAGRGKISAP